MLKSKNYCSNFNIKVSKSFFSWNSIAQKMNKIFDKILPYEAKVNFEMSFWCHRFNQKSNEILDKILPYEEATKLVQNFV